MSIAELVKKKRVEKGLTQEELGERIGVSSVAVSRWELGISKPKPKYRKMIAELLDINLKVLLGEEKVRLADFIEVPFYNEVQASAGNGYINSDNQSNEYTFIPVSSLQGSYKKNIVCIRATGESMMPVFGDGAILAVDIAKTTIKDNDIYVVSYNDSLRVKILFNTLTGVRLCSFNPMFGDEEYHHSELSSFRIIGRVIWYSFAI